MSEQTKEEFGKNYDIRRDLLFADLDSRFPEGWSICLWAEYQAQPWEDMTPENKELYMKTFPFLGEPIKEGRI